MKSLIGSRGVELVLWSSERTSKQGWLNFVNTLTVDHFEAPGDTCRRHRDQIMRAIGSLFEIEFHKDGDVGFVLPRTVKKGGSWFTLFWETPKKKLNHTRDVRSLERMINGLERLPRMPKKKMKVHTDHYQNGLTESQLELYGFAKVMLEGVGEEVVVVVDDRTKLPRGTHNGVPRFTIDEMKRLKWFVGMKPDPEMMCGVWLLKKHLDANVAVVS